MVALVGPIQIYSASNFFPISPSQQHYLEIMTHQLALVRSDDDDDDFRFWSERQAQRIANAIQTVLDIEFAPKAIVADANVSYETHSRFQAAVGTLD